MKKILSIMFLFVLLASSCSEEELVKGQSTTSGSPKFTASFEGDESRTYVEDGNLMRWTTGDQIALFVGNTLNRQYQFDGKTGDNSGTFSVVDNPFGTGNELNRHYAIYPYSKDIKITEQGIVTATLPARQSYAENSFGLGANTMVAVTHNVYDTFLKFKNVGGCLKLQLYGDNVTIKSITLKGNAHEKIAGTATITATYGEEPIVGMADDASETITLDCGEGVKIGATAEDATDFWMVVPPTTFEKGFEVTITDVNDNVMTKSTSNKISIARNVINAMAAFEVEIVETIPDNQIWYTSSAKVEPYFSNVFGVNISSNVWDEATGKGVITFVGKITAIGNQAFYMCNNLTSICIPNGVNSIGNYAFKGCESLESFTIPNSITSIGHCAFMGCSSLKSIIIPNNVNEIGEGSFCGCESLESIIVEQSNPVYDSRNNCNAVIETLSNTLVSGCKNTIIPNTIEIIGTSAFTGCTSLKNITIPNSVITIGMAAFAECSSLENIEISNNTTIIGGNAFYECRSLANITIPNNVTIIGTETFMNCVSLTSITIPDKIHTIERAAFYGCTSLSVVNVNPSIPPAIDNDTFNNCSNNVKFYVPAESIDDYKTAAYWKLLNLIETIPNNQIWYTSSNGEIITPSNIWGAKIISNKYESGRGVITFNRDVTIIGEYAFSQRNTLSSITLPNSVTRIEKYAFSSCSTLSNVDLSENLITIGEEVFFGCNLSNIRIPNSVTTIGNRAFYRCHSLTSITIPNSVTSIIGDLFPECDSLTKIIVEQDNPIYDSRDNCNAIIEKETNKLISGCKGSHIPATIEIIGEHAFANRSLINFMITDNVTTIESCAFYHCSFLTSVIIPNSVKTIGSQAFEGCSSMSNLTISNNVEILENATFSGCTSLTSITLPNSVTVLKDAVFSGCSSLTSITLSENLAIIGKYAFAYCSSLQKIMIPNTVMTIGERAFGGCSLLESLVIPNSVTAIGQYAFSGCNFLSSITLSNSLTSIENYTFENCRLLTNIIVPEGVTEIKMGAFYGCGSLSSLTLANSLISIGKESFRDCVSLANLIIPNSVETIGINAFLDCTSLREVHVQAINPPTLIYEIFNNCSKNIKIYVPSESLEAYEAADYWKDLNLLTE